MSTMVAVFAFALLYVPLLDLPRPAKTSYRPTHYFQATTAFISADTTSITAYMSMIGAVRIATVSTILRCYGPYGIYVHQLSACGLLGVVLWLHLANPGFANLVPQYNFASADSLLLVVGCVTFIVAFFGCCGAWFQSRFMLVTYFSLVILLFVGEFMIGALAFVFREHVTRTLKDELLFGIHKHYNITREPGTLPAVWDHIHQGLHCCGVRDYTDWFQIEAWPSEDRVPDSCCIKRERYCGRLDPEGRNKELWYKEGCASAIQTWMVTRLHVLGTAGLVVGFLQLFGLVTSMILFCTVRSKRSAHTYKSYDTANT